MAKTFFFYDLETSGLNPRSDRIMQFAGQRTDMELNPIAEPYNVLVKLNDDTLPSPEAVMVTGITPQSTQMDGYSEAEFAKLLREEIFTEDTIAVGFNSVRFDDEFVRHLFWRTFNDPYEWAWQDGRSRWDLLDVVRMTRALRPDGIEWPVDTEGRSVNRLELLTKVNGIEHENAHDALADVEALIGVSKLIKKHQPSLFEYLLKMRSKNEVQSLVNLDNKRPFVYVSGRYDATYEKATVAFPIAPALNKNVLVYDLRHDPSPFLGMSADEIIKNIHAPWEQKKSEEFVAVPVKALQYNRCPAVAPLGILNEKDGWNSIGLDLRTVKKYRDLLLARPDFAENVRTAFEQKPEYEKNSDTEAQLYESFIPQGDKIRLEAIRNADANDLADFNPEFQDSRLKDLFLHYKARNYPKSLSESEQAEWEEWRTERLRSQSVRYVKSIQKLSQSASESQQFLLQELQLWLENVMPEPDA
jgi:exodeoxyribonuclease-1